MRLIDADEIKEDFGEILEHDYADDYARGFQAALAAILGRETIALPPNDPLTLEELREMDGEPVWVSVSQDWRDSGIPDGWRLVRFHKYDDRVRCYIYDTHSGVNFCAEQDYGISWLAYRRKPEEG